MLHKFFRQNFHFVLLKKKAQNQAYINDKLKPSRLAIIVLETPIKYFYGPTAF